MAFSLSLSGATSTAKLAVRLGLSISHTDWLDWLADEWWPLAGEPSPVRLGVEAVRGARAETGGITVVAWIDSSRLPAVEVSAWQEGAWVQRSLDNLGLAREVSWPGPIPLHAVKSFSVATESDRARLAAMSKGFANVALPEQRIEVNEQELPPSVPERPPLVVDLSPPTGWNARRGAAAMAVWSVPAIAPWLDLLCNSLALEPPPAVAVPNQARWLAEPPWRAKRADDAGGDEQVQLWRAAVDVLSAVKIREAWRPPEIAEAIRDRACAEHGASPSGLDSFMSVTKSLLADELPAETALSRNDPVGSAIQLALLRPLPDRFVGWAQDVPALPPGVWWSGAILAGLVRGYRDLEQRFRGISEGRRRLPLRIWQLCSRGVGASWPGSTESAPTWRRDENGQISLLWDETRWADRVETSRGRWYEAELARKDVRKAATTLARRLQPSCLRQVVELSNLDIPISGPGSVHAAEEAPRRLSIKGGVRLEFPVEVSIAEDLDEEAFRNWLARDGISERLPDPPSSHRERRILELSDSQPVEVPGLKIVPDFISIEEENSLLETIAQQSWRQDLVRRVQHYGWAYNYRARKVDSDARLGPLPLWLARLAERLVAQELVPEPPDQVIINEYVGSQGIAKHVDCIPCFKGPIVMLSLLENWEMFFWPPGRGRPKVVRALQRRSAAIMSGDARERWSHEIPRRAKEPWGKRERRVSLTFRKVVPPTSGEPTQGARGKRGLKRR